MQRQRGVIGGGVDGAGDTGQAQGAGVAVEQRDAVEEECRREGAEQKVFQGGFLGQQPPAAGQPTHQVQRQREHFQRNEHRQQVVGGGEDHHAGDGEHGQREHLGLHQCGLGGDLLRDAARHRRRVGGERVQTRCASLGFGGHPSFRDQQDAQHADQQDGALQEQRGRVDGDGADHDGLADPAV